MFIVHFEKKNEHAPLMVFPSALTETSEYSNELKVSQISLDFLQQEHLP
jgi:hypothetical protein